MNKDDQQLSTGKFPSHADPNEKKDTFKWGTQVANAIEYQWYVKENNNSRFYINRNTYRTLRLYAQGDQDIRRYKDEFSLNGDLSYLNLDWTPVPIIPKFVDVVVNGMQDRAFSVKAQAVDPVASADRGEYLDTLRSEMNNKDALMALEKTSGVEVFENDPNKLPGSEDELEVHMQLDYKQGVEIAMETAIDYELNLNEYPNIKYKVDYDLTVVGIGAIKHQFIPGEGIKIEYIDPADLIFSDSESIYYEDSYYFGEVKRMHITDLQVQFPSMDAELVMELEKGNKNISDNYDTSAFKNQNDDAGYIDVLFFCYKTVHNEIYKIKDSSMGTPKAIQRGADFDPPADKRAGFERTARSNEVIYEGVKILGKDTMLKWELQKNMIRPSLQSPKVIMPYIVCSPKQYNGKIYSLVKRMEKYADAIQLIHLKIQQVIQKMTPSGVFLDVDGLAEIDLGNGTQYNPQTALDMYFQTGSVLGRSLTDEGEFNNGKVPIQELPGSGGAQLQPLLAAYEYNLQQIRNVTGLNESRDGSTPDPDALVGVQKLAAANSNTATRHILQGSEYMKRRLSEGICLRINDVLEYSPTKNDYLSAIGKYNVEILEDLGKMSMHEYGIFIELGPDEEEKAKLDAHIQASISRGELKIEDAVDVMQIPNIRLANQVLKMKREQRVQQEQEFQKQNIDRQNQGLIQVAQETEQAKSQGAQIKAQSQIQIDTNKSQLDMQKLERETQLEIEILRYKADLEAELNGMKMSHEDNQNNKKRSGENQREQTKAAGAPSTTAGVSIGNKANTADGKIRTGGLL